jgi:CO dehydrogenase maturation factor
VELAGVLPEDPTISAYDIEGRPTVEMPEDCASIKAAFELFNTLIG